MNADTEYIPMSIYHKTLSLNIIMDIIFVILHPVASYIQEIKFGMNMFI